MDTTNTHEPTADSVADSATSGGTRETTHFVLTNQLVSVTTAPPAVKRWLRGFLSYETVKWDRDYRTKRVTFGGKETHSLYDIGDNTFLAGFLPLVTRKLGELGFPYEVEDTRAPEPELPNLDPEAVRALLPWLRERQLAGVLQAARKERGIVKWVTGSGKGELPVAFLRLLPGRGLFVVNSAQLVNQTAERVRTRYEQHGWEQPHIGIVGDGNHDYRGKLVCATFQTLARNLRKPEVQRLLKSVAWVLVDECHSLPSATFSKVISACAGARRRIGLSGTPLDRADAKSTFVVGLLGPVIHQIKPAELIADGVLSEPDIQIVRYHADPLAESGWARVYEHGIVKHKERNEAVVWAALQAETPLVFVRTLDHGRFLTKELQRAGKTVEFIFGAKPVATREAACKRLTRGDIDVIVCSDVFTTGIDLPAVRGIVMAAGGKAVISTLQRLGRGSRPKADGDNTFDVFDFDDRHHGTLATHSQKRRGSYRKEGYKVRFVASVTGGTDDAEE